jgi:hypothetical protein
MQDQPHYKITPEQGWAKMKPILEEAMPAGRSSRRFPFLWWSTTAVLITAISGFLLLNGTSSFNEQTSATSSKIMTPATGLHDSKVISPASPESKVEPDNTNQSIQTSDQETITPAHPSNPSSDTPRGNTSSKVKSKIKSNKVVPLAIVVDEKQMDISSAIPISNEVAGSGVSSDHDSDNGIVETASLPYVSLRDQQVVDPLTSIGVLAFMTPDMDTPGVPAGTVTKARHQPRRIEANLAVSGLAGAQGGRGLYGGAGANVNMGRHFSLTTGVGYLSFNPDATLLGGSKELDANAGTNAILNYDPSYLGNEVYVESNAINRAAGYNEINSLVDKVTQWQVSAGLKWKINSRFFTEVGAQVGWNTRAFSSYPISEPDPLTAPGVRFENSLNDFNVIRSTTTSLYGGLGYRIGHHVDVFANWTHGLDQYILNDSPSAPTDQFAVERTDYIRGLSLGLKYTL